MDWLRDHLVRVVEYLAKDGDPYAWDAPSVPLSGARVWRIFLALHATRGEGFSRPLPIAFAEIEAWARLHREPLRPFEIEILQAIDAAWLAAVTAKAQPQEKARQGESLMSQLREIAKERA